MTRPILRWAAPVVVVAAVLAFYGRALHRGFTSEDFLLLRLLREDPPWRDFLAKLASPWLDLQLFQFYRPVSTLLFGIEDALFGVSPFGYNLVHTLVHAANALLVFALARRIAGPPAIFPALAAALLFALHPLHPNAVIFPASFATLFAAAFLLAAFLCHQLAAERASRVWELAALGLFALALGSYEATAVLPGLLVAHDLLLSRDRPLRSRVLAWLPFFGLLGLYFLLRLHLFGVFLGGYEETSRRLLAPQLRQLAGDLGYSLYRLHAPVFEGLWVAWAAPGLFLLLAFLVPLLYLGLSASRRGALRPWLFGWIWMVLSLAPFAFHPVVPGNGRYWYFAAVGAALDIAFLAQALFAAWRRPWRLLPPVAVLALLAGWGALLVPALAFYVQAGQTARAIATQLEGALRVPGGSPVFVAGAPAFMTNLGGPVAAVFHYGLHDAVNPPFAPTSAPVYPLPPLALEELSSLSAGRPQARIYEWEPGSAKLRQVTLAPTPSPAELPVVAPADGARLGPRDVAVTLRPGPGRLFRLVVLAQGNPNVTESAGARFPDGTLRIALPRPFLLAMDRLYGGGEVYWWVETRDERGQLLWTRMRSFTLQRLSRATSARPSP